MRHLCRRLRETTDQLETIALYDLDSRVARFFLATLKQIHGDDLPDPSEKTNLASQMPDKVSELQQTLTKISAADRDAVARD